MLELFLALRLGREHILHDRRFELGLELVWRIAEHVGLARGVEAAEEGHLMTDAISRGHPRQSKVPRGEQGSSEAIKGPSRPSKVLRGNQRSLEAIKGPPRQSKVPRGHQRSSEAIKGPWRQSKVLRGNQRSLEAIKGPPRQSKVLLTLHGVSSLRSFASSDFM
jgi:hypothetical protein